MAQTTGAMNTVGGKVEISTDGVPTWTDISGFLNMVDPGESIRQTGSVFTADGDTPILGAGKRELLQIVVNIVYTEGGSEPWEVVRGVHEAGDIDIQLRWSPAGGTTGDFQFTTAKGTIASLQYPGVDPNTAAPSVLSFTLATPYYTKATAA